MSTVAGARDTTGELALAETDLRAAADAPGRTRPRALSTLSSVLQFEGKLEDANVAASQAYEADAFFTEADGIVLMLFNTSLELGRFADAARWCDHGAQNFPDNWRFRMCRLRLLAWSPETRPDVPTAWRLLSQLDSLADPDERAWLMPQMRLAVAAVIAAAGLRDSAERVIAAVGSAAPGDPDLLYYEALARARLGQTRAVARLLQELLRRMPNYEPSLRSDLEFRGAWADSAATVSTGPFASCSRGNARICRSG